MSIIESNISEICALCSQHKVSNMSVFGSVLTNRFSDESDIDLLVNFKKEEISDYFDNFFELKYALEALLGRSVDLVEEHTIKNPYLKASIDNSKALIYGGQN
mgnify:FL=1